MDYNLRLPNSDLCPPNYNPDDWRSLNSIHKRTFKVVDLEGFCQVLGEALGVWGYVTNVKVSAVRGPGCLGLCHQCQGQYWARPWVCGATSPLSRSVLGEALGVWGYVTNVKVSAWGRPWVWGYVTNIKVSAAGGPGCVGLYH